MYSKTQYTLWVMDGGLDDAITKCTNLNTMLKMVKSKVSCAM